MVDFLPAYEDLTEEQDHAMRHPGSLLVTGPPGSGKTVVALYRAYELQKQERRAYILTYGKVLAAYITECLKSQGINGIEKSTFHKWFPKYYKGVYGCRPPMLSRFDFDWERIERQFSKSGFQNGFDQLIIDEAQDLPTEFLRLAPYISEGITVFADENQAIFQNNTSIKNIRLALKRFEPKNIELKKNFRNTRQIAEFSSLFKTKGIETGVADIPDREGNLPLLCKMKNMDHQVNRIRAYMPTINAQNKTVGVFLSKKIYIKEWQEKLSNACKGTSVQYYASGEKVNGRWLPPPDFSKKGIYIVSDWTAKGLEFDYVFVPDMQKLQNNTGQIMRCYVAFSRAKDMLVMMYCGNEIPDLVKEQLYTAETNGKKLVEKEGLEKAEKTSAKIFRQTARDIAPADSIALKEFIEYCKNEMDERRFMRIERFFKAVFAEKKEFYTKKEIANKIVFNLPGKLRETLLSLLLQFVKFTKGEL